MEKLNSTEREILEKALRGEPLDDADWELLCLSDNCVDTLDWYTGSRWTTQQINILELDGKYYGVSSILNTDTFERDYEDSSVFEMKKVVSYTWEEA